jgi:hypothetical protein
LWTDARVRDHQLVSLVTANPEADRRRRRALTPEEAARLIRAAESGPTLQGISGPDRAVLYRLALGTGFRASELASLTPASFRLAVAGKPPTVVCEAGYTKNGKRAEQRIKTALAAVLRPWLASKAPGRPVFRPTRRADMIRADLEAAGVPYETDEGVVDFHALRVTYISNLVASGASVKTCQTLARHSTPSLTIGVYAKASLHDIAGAVEGLPDPDAPSPAAERARATGTGGRIGKHLAHPLPIAGDGDGRDLSESAVMQSPDMLPMKTEETSCFSAPDGDSGVMTALVGASGSGGGTADKTDRNSLAWDQDVC